MSYLEHSQMLSKNTSVRAASLAVFYILCVRICMGTTELNAEEGKEFTLTCSGNVTKELKNIWWTSNNKELSKCYLGKERCINKEAMQYTAINSNRYQKYTSKLTIHKVSSNQRDQIFKCGDDGSKNYREQSFLLQVYHIPESPVCKAEELSRGRIKVSCNTSKVYPDIICEISQEFRNDTDILDEGINFSTAIGTTNVLYNVDSFTDGTADYKKATCGTVINTVLPGLYRFKVKMHPNITNGLVASVDGYTDIIRVISSAESRGERVLIDKEGRERSVDLPSGARGKAESLTGEESFTSKEGQTINREVEISQLESICENDKDIIRRQLIVIMFLSCLLACNFLFQAFPLIKDMCNRTKRSDRAQV